MKKDSVGLTRRQLLGMALAAPLAPVVLKAAAGFGKSVLQNSPARVELERGATNSLVSVVRSWNGDVCRSQVVNKSAHAERVKQVVLFETKPGFAAETSLYGEGFQMLSQTAGTIGKPDDLSQYTDEKHYKIPAQGRAFYGLVSMTPPGDETRVLAFTSCAKYVGRFEMEGDTLRVVVDLEGAELPAHGALPLEDFAFMQGPDSAKLLDAVAKELAKNHKPLKFAAPPAGWCSWYCFGAKVTAQQVLDNLDVIAKSIPTLKYVQIDDGYQPAMGDWLETGTAFGGNVQTVLAEIRKRGFEPAIWVAPFIAEENSHVFQQHQDWFVKDDSGAPLRSDKVTFGGWRHGPWYVLDGTHPEAQAHLEQVFKTMRNDWGCTYFKLDANFWGAIHGGTFHDKNATRVEAYRRGMAAVRRGSGDSFILGCNHPIWPSIGEVHGSRSSNDIKRSWDRITTTARQNLSRNWQNGRLWWNDPDAVCLSDLADNELQFHATAIYATGGMVLSGDDLTQLPPARVAVLRKLLPPTGVAAKFADAKFEMGETVLPDRRMISLFNWGDAPRRASVALRATEHASEFWTGAVFSGTNVLTIEIPARSARLVELAHV